MPNATSGVPVGLSTKTSLVAAGGAFLGAIVNAIAKGPVEQTIAGVAGGFSILSVMVGGRMYQAGQSAKLPHGVEIVAQILDKIIEQKVTSSLPKQAAVPAAATTVASPPKSAVDAAAEAARNKLGR